jgi:hypothetical protein
MDKTLLVLLAEAFLLRVCALGLSEVRLLQGDLVDVGALPGLSRLF